MIFLRIAIFFAVFSVLAIGHKNAAARENDCSYTFGVVPQYEARHLYNTWVPVLDIMAEKTGCEFQYVSSKSAVDFEEALKQGNFDLAYVNPVQVVIGYLSNGYMPFLRPKSVRLKGILVVRKDDPIEDIHDLEGEKIVFPPYIDIEATLLLQRALKEKFNITGQQLHVKTHGSVYLHVGKKLARAGGGSYASFNKQPEYIKDNLRVLYETEEIYPHALIIHGLIEDKSYADINKAFMEIYKENPELLEKISLNNPVQADIEEYIGLEMWIQQ